MRTFLTLLVIVLLVWLFKPSTVWRELKRMWSQRELMLRTLVVIILIYLAYGFYELYERGWFTPDD